MIEIIFERSEGVEQIAYFNTELEFKDWYRRQLLLHPDTEIISKNEEA